jgi:hypothetical protein
MPLNNTMATFQFRVPSQLGNSAISSIPLATSYSPSTVLSGLVYSSTSGTNANVRTIDVSWMLTHIAHRITHRTCPILGATLGLPSVIRYSLNQGFRTVVLTKIAL